MDDLANNFKRCSRPECPSHGKPQPVENFSTNRNSPDGKHWYCRVCHNAIQQEWKRANPGKVREWRERYLAKNKKKNRQRERQLELDLG